MTKSSSLKRKNEKTFEELYTCEKRVNLGVDIQKRTKESQISGEKQPQSSKINPSAPERNGEVFTYILVDDSEETSESSNQQAKDSAEKEHKRKSAEEMFLKQVGYIEEKLREMRVYNYSFNSKYIMNKIVEKKVIEFLIQTVGMRS